MRTHVSTLLIAFMIFATLGRPITAEQPFLRGDSNASGEVTLADALTTLGHIFLRSPESLPCQDAADANDNGSLSLADGLYTLRFLFVEGPKHPAPGNECGTDPTDDDLDCAEFEPCPEDDPGDPGDPVETIEYDGDQIVLVGDVAPGESVAFDVDRDAAGFEVEVVADDDGVFTAVVDASGLDDADVILRRIGEDGATEAVATLRTSGTSPDNAVPEAAPGNVQAAICLCGSCTKPKLADALTRSPEPKSHGVLLADGTFVELLSVLGFAGRLFDFRFDLYHQTLTDYAGPLGESMSHSFNLFIVQDSEDEGVIVTPDLRIFSITRGSDDEWDLPEGFYGRLIRNAEQGRWILTLHQGTTFELLIGAEGLPGRLFRIREPNGNRMRVELDTSGRMTAVLTDLDQRVTFERDDDARIAAVVDPMGREWSFQYDDLGRLTGILTPESEFADI